MSQIGFDTIGNDWVDISTIGTLTTTKSYQIQNRGAGVLLVVEGASEPSTDAGEVLNPLERITLTYGTDKIWVKSIFGKSAINIREI